MKDLIWDIAKSGEEALENTELQTIEEPKELFVARGVSLEAKDSTYKINKFVDNKIALDVQEKGAIKISDTAFSRSHRQNMLNSISYNCFYVVIFISSKRKSDD